MKKSILFSLMALFVASFTFAHHGPDHKTVYAVNSEKSTITWVGKKVTGEHTGNISIKSGTVLMDHGKAHAVDLSIDMTSITCTDLEDDGYNKKLIGHLSSDDFFSVKTHNESKFTTTGFEDTTEGLVATGNLTIKGITHAITFPVTINEDNGMLSATGTATFDRTKWDIKYGSGQFFDSLGDKMIYDDISLTFSLVASVVK